jgi:DNA-binding NarL/FixJ family response regulator
MDDHEIDAAGVSAVLGRFDERISLVDLGPMTPEPPDVILYGVREHHAWHDADLHLLLRGQTATVIVLGWGAAAPQLEWALSCGAHGRLSKTMTGEELVSGVERIHLGGDRALRPPGDYCHPGLVEVGLTPRELEVLTLITQCHTNQEIAERMYISINSVKTYIRTAYRKIGVARRSQAVSWGVQHGLDLTRGNVGVLEVPVG